MTKTVIASVVAVIAICILVVAKLPSAKKVDVLDKDVVAPIVVSTPTQDPSLNVGKLKLTRVTGTEDNVILLNTEITDLSVDAVISKLDELAKTQTEVYLIITSPGGSVVDGNKLVAYIEDSPLEINTVCEKFCASMGFHIFEAGKKRYMVGHTVLMAHPPSGGARGTIPEMLSQLNAIRRLTDELDARVAQRAKLKYADFSIDVLKNLWVTSNEAVKMGLADSLIHITYPIKNGKTFNTEQELLKQGVKLDKLSTKYPLLQQDN